MTMSRIGVWMCCFGNTKVLKKGQHRKGFALSHNVEGPMIICGVDCGVEDARKKEPA